MITFDLEDKVEVEVDDETGNITLEFDRQIPEDMEDMLQMILIHVMHTDGRVMFSVRPKEANNDRRAD